MADRRLSAKLKLDLATRASWCCEYCRSQALFSADPFSVEHIVPRSRGGTNDPSNLALSCQGCNNFKYTSVEAADPVNGEIVPLFHPRREDWNEHFMWSEDSTEMLGLTPIGRATIVKLKLNRPGVVNLRRVLKLPKNHPPRKGWQG